MHYRAIASPKFAAQYFGTGFDAAALARAPMIVFNRKDELQWRFMRRITRARLSPPVNYLPTSSGVIEAAALGLGWCVAPESLAAQALGAKKIVIVDSARWLDVPLYWQLAAVRSTTLEQISRALREAAASALRE
jgi:LysR family transcriptional regulator (chromosome initiation inhibitor)